MVHFQSLRLLGSHIRGCSNPSPNHRHAGRSVAQRKAEVQNAGIPLAAHDYVVRLDIPVDNSVAVRFVQASRNLNRDVRRCAERQRTAALICKSSGRPDTPWQRKAALHFVDLVNRTDIRMLQERCRLRLVDKPVLVFAGHRLHGKKLQRYQAVQTHVFRFIDNAHSALAELTGNYVMEVVEPIMAHRKSSTNECLNSRLPRNLRSSRGSQVKRAAGPEPCESLQSHVAWSLSPTQSARKTIVVVAAPE